MKDIQTPHELIDRLARRGDPVAFHTLLAGHIGASYRQLRDHGRSDTEALDELRPFLHEIYREFLDHPPTLPTEEWYAAHAARRLGTQGPASAEEVSLDALMTRETAPPHDAFGLEIQRAHSAWSRQRKRRSTIPRPIRHRPNRMVLTGLALVALLVGGAYAWLMLTHTTLSVSLIGASGTSRQILLPLGARPAPLPPNSPPSGGGEDSTAVAQADSSRLSDDTPAPSSQENVSHTPAVRKPTKRPPAVTRKTPPPPPPSRPSTASSRRVRQPPPPAPAKPAPKPEPTIAESRPAVTPPPAPSPPPTTAPTTREPDRPVSEPEQPQSTQTGTGTQESSDPAAEQQPPPVPSTDPMP